MKEEITIREMAKKIEDHAQTLLRREYAPGLIIKSVGRKYVHVLSIRNRTSVTRENIEDFYYYMLYSGKFATRTA